ncbi:MAG TPA: MBL fold metallo-hydrolase [Rubrivivax sp.]|nr:MBL fold metallo-hydrolase [Rubrivivax sp.]
MANAQEDELQYPLGARVPAPAEVLEVADGVRWLRPALPFALDHINLWLLRDREDGPGGQREGWTVVDCGLDNPGTRAAWERVFAEALDGLPVLRVVCTHMHPDHIGLAHWLCERWQCRLWISAADWAMARAVSLQSGDAHSGDSAAAFFARHGLADPDSLAKVRARRNYYVTMVPAVPPRYRRLMHGMALRIGAHAWRCHAGFGHAPEHMALHAPTVGWRHGGGGASGGTGALISGDMVLPRISTNVSVMEFEPEANPLALYLDSIAALRALPAHTLVLPSHGRPFVGLHRRIDQLGAHHAERFAQVLEACAHEPRSAADLLDVLFARALDLHQTVFALGESIAHVHALAERGQLEAVPGADGVLRWRSVAGGDPRTGRR